MFYTTSESNDRIYRVSSAHSEVQELIIIIQWLLLLFLMIGPVYQEVTILFSLTRECFMQHSNFVHKLDSQFLMETRIMKHVMSYQLDTTGRCTNGCL